MTTTAEFAILSDAASQYRFTITAHDQGVPPKPTEASVLINVIENINRFVLPVNDMTTSEVLVKVPEIVRRLQIETGYVIIVEKVEGKRVISQRNNIQTVVKSTDLYFVAGYAEEPYVLINTTSSEAISKILSKDRQDNITTIIGEALNKDVDNIRLPYSDTVIYRSQITKSYLWWMDDPWAPLVALAAIIILLAIVGIIVIIFSHSRYLKFITEYRHYQVSYPTDFREPDNFLREYETQSLNMYVPPDDANLNAYGEVGLRLQDEGLVDVQHSAHDPGVAAAVNPVYQSDEPPAQLDSQAQAAPLPESATIL
eukprot:TRINITY_DN84561_c0_g1_i2.p1 TRINITY_DN84561_c0_g1~~TRINITY_DN84561_c0_g1_i2.p1  ORF type:complete len:313 (-),score=73.06 TRINITY_DN84561_c0_g1_i2:127-1065(-)